MTMTRRDYLAIDTARSQQRQAGRANLREMAARNVADKRARLTREGKARRAAALRRVTPAAAEPVKPSGVPVTFKAERPERRRVTRPATTTAPAPVKAKPAPEAFERIEHVPVKAVDLPKELREKAKCALRGDFCDDTSGWLLAGPWERDGQPVNVYVRKHGASARYSTCN